MVNQGGTRARQVAISPLRNRAFVMMLTGSAGLFFGFSLLVSVVPLWVVRTGAGEFAAGAATGVFMAATVLAQLAMTGLVARFGYRAMAVVGALLIGVPAPFLLISLTWQPIIALSFVRGLGFGIVTVCGSALIAELLPEGAHGRGSGLYGMAVGLPLLIGLPASTWLAQQVSFGLVFGLACALPLLAIGPLLALPGATRAPAVDDSAVIGTMVAVWRPWLAMLAGSVAFGAMVTFLPLAFIDAPLAGSAALLLMSATALAARWAAGSWGDRLGVAGRLLFPGLACTAGGLLGLAVGIGIAGTAAIMLGLACVAVYGAGFGVVQNDALVVMFLRTSAARASVAWNIAFDAGQGVGAVAVGALVSATSYSIAFGALGIFAAVLLPAVYRPRVTRRAGTVEE